MTATINASTSSGVVVTSDTSGSLALQTASTTAMTINSSQVVNFANTPTIGGSAFPSGAMTLISTQTANNTSSSLTWTGLATYNNYLIVFSALNTGSGSNIDVFFQTGTGSSPTWSTSNYRNAASFAVVGGSSVSFYQTSSASGLSLTANQGQAYGTLSGSLILCNAINSSGYGYATGNALSYSSSTNMSNVNFSGYSSTNTGNITAVRLITASGNIISGSASLYGISS